MISRVDVQPGDEVDENQVLAVVEAMKMETSIVAPRAGVIDQVLIKKGDNVKAGELLITLK
jgi:pyruvate carboxylase